MKIRFKFLGIPHPVFGFLLYLSTLPFQLSTLHAQGTAFTYQGQLKAAGIPANGIYDFTFQVFDAPSGGSSLGGTLGTNSVSVNEGVFAVTLDFGAGVFTGPARWLQISVSTNLAGSFSTLLPRQRLTPSPYAVFAGTSATVTNGAIGTGQLAVGAVGTSQIQTGAITAPLIPSGQVVKTLNSLSDNVTLTSGPNITINTVGNSLQISAPNTGGWGLSGNTGTSPTNGNFIGTTDNQPLEFRVNARRGFRLEPFVNDAFHSNMVNIVNGGPGNYVAPGVSGATIAGGGATSFAFTSGYTNSITGDLGTIGGGGGNSVAGLYNTISGGRFNSIDPFVSDGAIGGGGGNRIQYNVSDGVIAGGNGNLLGTNANYSAIGGGANNSVQINAEFSGIAAGRDNSVRSNADYSFVGGGSGNAILPNALYATIGGGLTNVATRPYATVAGGVGNTASGDGATAGGWGCAASGGAATAIGYYAIASGNSSTALGSSSATGLYSAALGVSLAGGSSSTAGGYSRAYGDYSTAMGFSWATNTSSTAMGYSSASGYASTALGYSSANGYVSTAMGSSTAGGNYSTAMGWSATAGAYSLAAGSRASANHDGSFVWADNHNVEFASTTTNKVRFRCTSGFDIVTAIDGSGNQTAGVFLGAGGTSWNTISDHNAKKNITPVNTTAVLERLATLQISKWNYKWEADTNTPHLGPMAQDFKCAFYPGRDDKAISTLEFDGVELAAIQALNQKLETTRTEVRRRDTENAELKQGIEQLNQKLESENAELKRQNASLAKRLEALEQTIREQRHD